MEEHDRLPLALVEVGQAEAVELAVVRGEREVREALEQLVGGADRVGHGLESYGPSTIAWDASDATVMSIVSGVRSQAIRLRA